MSTKKSVAVPDHEDVTVLFNRLHFDPLNPRGEPEPDEEKIRALYGAQPETAALAAHIAEHGLNPIDRIAIVAHPKLPGHFVIREGNRRLCAMQILRDTQRAPTPAVEKQFKRLAEGGRPVPDKIQAVLFNEKPQARVWMSVKHEGPQNGLGTLTWGALQKARFNREGETGTTRPKNPNRQADALLTYAIDHSLITQEQRALIALTTVTRYLPNVRAALALLNTEDCTTNAPVAEFNAALKRFLQDAVDNGDPNSKPAVHSRSASSERKTYAERLRTEGASPTTRDLAAYDPAQRPPTLKIVAGRNARDPAKRKRLIPSQFIVSNKDPALIRLVKEGKELDPDEARFSCNYLNRVILEKIVHLYARKHCGGGQGDFAEVVQRVIAHAKASANPPTKGIALVLTKAADKKSSYSYEIMSNSIHGGSIPAGADNRSNWESLQPSLEYLLLALT